MFPSEMIANIDPKEFSYIGLFKGFTSKGERNVGANKISSLWVYK